MVDETNEIPAHILADIARKDTQVLELCERFGFGFVMGSAARQWAVRDPVGAFTVGMPTGLDQEAAERIRGRAGLDAAVKAMAGVGRGTHSQMRTNETMDQVRAFAEAAGARTITGVHEGQEAEFAYEPASATLMVEGLRFPLATLDASHGRLYSNPYDEARTVHSLSLHDRAAGTCMRLEVA